MQISASQMTRALQSSKTFLLFCAAGLSACTPFSSGRSSESAALQEQLVPSIVRWSKSDSVSLELHEIPIVLKFEYICYVPEYDRYSEIQRTISNVSEYEGISGVTVPEGESAILGVSDGVAHAAFVDQESLILYGQRSCVKSERAKLLKQNADYTNITVAKLEG